MMTDVLQGPWKQLTGPDGTSVPYYIVPFDKAGTCTGPRTADDLVAAAAGATDVFLFSHGWNNDWKDATERYQRFADQFVALHGSYWNPPDRPFRPVLVGVFWPSIVLVAASEEGPDFAGGGPPADSTGQELASLQALADAVGGAPPERFYDLAHRKQLTGSEALELAEIIAPALAGRDEDLGRAQESVSAQDLVTAWSRMAVTAPRPDTDPGGFIDDDTAGGPMPAGLLDWFDPREIVRVATVLLMKDRAGRVGAHGVADLLRRVVAASDSSRVHLVGHSYGAKVVLSALCQGAAPARPVDSVLLLQPALSALCFARDVDGHPGGYRPALQPERCRQPVLTTFSRHDVPLTKLFHLAVRRSSDLGEVVIAGAPPSRFAALGGFGPQGLGGEATVVEAVTPTQTYDLAPEGVRVIGVRSDAVISGHGDVENQATAWALLCQVRG